MRQPVLELNFADGDGKPIGALLVDRRGQLATRGDMGWFDPDYAPQLPSGRRAHRIDDAYEWARWVARSYEPTSVDCTLTTLIPRRLSWPRASLIYVVSTLVVGLLGGAILGAVERLLTAAVAGEMIPEVVASALLTVLGVVLGAVITERATNHIGKAKLAFWHAVLVTSISFPIVLAGMWASFYTLNTEFLLIALVVAMSAPIVLLRLLALPYAVAWRPTMPSRKT